MAQRSDVARLWLWVLGVVGGAPLAGVIVGAMVGVGYAMTGSGDDAWRTLGAVATAVVVGVGAAALAGVVGAVLAVRRNAGPGRRRPVLVWSTLSVVVLAAAAWIGQARVPQEHQITEPRLFAFLVAAVVAVLAPLVVLLIRELPRLRRGSGGRGSG